MASTGYYWVGQDGNVWSQNTDGSASNKGRFLRGNDNGYDAELASGVARRIADPAGGGGQVQGVTDAPSNPNGYGGGGAVAEPKVLNQAGINNTQLTIDQIPSLLAAALEAENTRYGNTVRQFNQEEQGQRKTYGDSTVTNTKNYDANFMDSIRAGIKGLGGLMSLLRGTGASGGTAEDLARDTVGGVTSQDIRGGADTRDENQTALDTTLSAFLTDLNRKKASNEDAFENNKRAVTRDSNTQLQDLFGKMAGFYGDVGDQNNANAWMNRAGALTPSIARDSMTRVSNYDTAPVTVKAPELTAFAAPTKPSIEMVQDGQVGSGIFTMSEPKRKKELAPPLVPVGV